MNRYKRNPMIKMSAVNLRRQRAACGLSHRRKRSGRLPRLPTQKIHRPSDDYQNVGIEYPAIKYEKMQTLDPALRSNPHSPKHHRTQTIQRCGFLPWVLSVACS